MKIKPYLNTRESISYLDAISDRSFRSNLESHRVQLKNPYLNCFVNGPGALQRLAVRLQGFEYEDELRPHIKGFYYSPEGECWGWVVETDIDFI